MAAHPQNQYASVGRIALSYCAEVILLFAGVLLLQGLLVLLRLNPLVNSVLSGSGLSKGVYHLWLLGTVDLPLVIYYTGTLASSAQATLLMRSFGLRLESESGEPVGLGRALVRTAVMLIPFEVNHFFLVWANSPKGVPNRLSLQYAIVGILVLAYVLTAARSQRRQSVHDWVAGTVVVRTPHV